MQVQAAGFNDTALSVFKSEDGHTLVVPVGKVYGFRLSADGIIVSGLADVYSGGKNRCPAREAGLQPGDFLLKANGQPLESCEQFTQLVCSSGGTPIEVEYRRGETTGTVTLRPVCCDNDGVYKTGLWIKDGISGIGTVTFVDPETGVFASLGHGICDGDTGDLVSCDGGDLLQVTLGEIIRSTSGSPGELTGSLSGNRLGGIAANTPQGVYGVLYGGTAMQEAMEAAHKEEISTGPAEVMVDLTGCGPQRYTVEVERINPQNDAESKNFIVHITDQRLLSLTGGIVQGMSGSPIIQNGKLVGAVTHVLVNDPTRGYGIYIENMLDAAG